MAPALPFPMHKHPPTQVEPLGLLDGPLPGLPADQGDTAPIEDSAVEEAAAEEIAEPGEGEAASEAPDTEAGGSTPPPQEAPNSPPPSPGEESS